MHGVPESETSATLLPSNNNFKILFDWLNSLKLLYVISLFLILYVDNIFFVTLVSSAAIKSTSFNTSIDLLLTSFKFPIGVDTIYKSPNKIN